MTDQDEATAIANINGVTGLSVGTVTYVYSSTVAAGDVMSQSITDPVALLGSDVDLVISLGPPPLPASNRWGALILLLTIATVFGMGYRYLRGPRVRAR